MGLSICVRLGLLMPISMCWVILRQELLVIDLMEELEFGFKSVCEEEYDRKGGRIVAAKFSNNDPKLLALTFATKFVILRI